MKKKRQAKLNSETVSANACGTPVGRTSTGKEDGSKVALVQSNGSQENGKHSGEKEDYEKKKKKSSQPKDIRRTDLKRFYSIGEFNVRFVIISFEISKCFLSVATCDLEAILPLTLLGCLC